MHRAAARLWLAAALAAAATACSCGDPAADGDAGLEDGGPVRDASPRGDANAPLIWIDFSVNGCDEATSTSLLAGGPDAGPDVDAGMGADAGPASDGGPARPDAGAGEVGCTGAAPLALSFVPVAPAPVELHEWSFGDGSDPDRSAAPEHVYTDPGIYDVSLFGQGPGGTAAITRAGFVQVLPGRLGGACSADGQCASGACVCGAEPCAGLASGFCSAGCGEGAPCEDGACADLAAGQPPAPAPWQARLCLPGCGDGEACPAGTGCADLRRGDGDGWIRGCVPPELLGGIGDPCADETGQLDDSRCASGQCLAIGLRGACSAPCGDEACPADAACATWNGGAPEPSCVARCGGAASCADDPWLACEAPGGGGALGFSVDEEPDEAGYCAPSPCAGNDECAPGQCAAGFCAG